MKRLHPGISSEAGEGSSAERTQLLGMTSHPHLILKTALSLLKNIYLLFLKQAEYLRKKKH